MRKPKLSLAVQINEEIEDAIASLRTIQHIYAPSLNAIRPPLASEREYAMELASRVIASGEELVRLTSKELA